MEGVERKGGVRPGGAASEAWASFWVIRRLCSSDDTGERKYRSECTEEAGKSMDSSFESCCADSERLVEGEWATSTMPASGESSVASDAAVGEFCELDPKSSMVTGSWEAPNTADDKGVGERGTEGVFSSSFCCPSSISGRALCGVRSSWPARGGVCIITASGSLEGIGVFRVLWVVAGVEQEEEAEEKNEVRERAIMTKEICVVFASKFLSEGCKGLEDCLRHFGERIVVASETDKESGP